VKQLSLILKRKLTELNPSSLLSSGLLGLLLVIYIYTIYAIVITLGTFPFGKQPAFSLIQPSEHWMLNSIALLCLALTIVPVTRWLHRRVNDLVYAQDDSLYALPVIINQQLRGMKNPQLTMPQVVETIGMMLHLPYVVLEFGAEGEQRFSFGSALDQATIHEFPLHYLNQPLGTLLVSNRTANRSLSHSDHVVLQESAQQIGIALYVAQLTDVLQTSREQIVIAREEERRRIRNDLHDGLAPTLSSFQLQLGAIRRLVPQNPAQAEQMIVELSADLRQATAEIRQLVYDLRPPMLDELGLIKALSHMRLAGASLELDVIAPDPMPTLSAATEVAIYRIATEAIHNVVKHAHATTCTISITVDAETLTLTITDDGHGMSASHRNGIGTESMRERAAELGGTCSVQPAEPLGTRIEVRLPWRDDNG
jgi:two-component system NarL family sensor kinase